ncbi:hypothetical protein [Actinomadura rudentiformis]|uniref:Secreted protein n=1 Tax=Actinomadura rudentiformis TaxID=359158 RepID=A0A6H9Z8V7_9ACTN|nr:hypothetical protein [Actinomadura rudentiformis]KAB2350326.1 hypothetical protein F8566_11160 [Actinomadura rudentiformis]
MTKKKTLALTATAVAAVTAGAVGAAVLSGPDQVSAGRAAGHAAAADRAAAQASTQTPQSLRDRYPHGLRHDAVTKGVQRPAKARRLSAQAGVQVTLDVLDRHGKPAASQTLVEFYPLTGDDPFYTDLQNGHAEGELPAGQYAVLTRVATAEQDGTTSSALVYRPKVAITKAAKLVLDAREAKPIAATVDRADARLLSGEVRVVQKIAGRPVVTSSMMELKDAYITPTGSTPGLALDLQAVFTRKGAETGSPYVYNIVNRQAGGVPQKPGLHVRTKDLAAVRTAYGTEGRPVCVGGHASPLWTEGGIRIGFYTGVGAGPIARTEYYSPGITWDIDWMNTTPDCGFEFDTTEVWRSEERFPKAGSYQRRLTPAPFGPRNGVVIWNENEGGEPALAIGTHSTGAGTSVMAPYPGATGTSVLREASGKIVYTYDQPGAAWNWPVPKPGKYSLTVDEERAAPFSPLAVRQHVVWHFAVRDDKVIKLPSLTYRTPLDAQSRAKAGARQQVTMTTARTGTAAPKLWASSDDGKTWKAVTVTRNGNAWVATLTNPKVGFVSLRAAVAGVIDQTVIRAYAVHG